MDLVCVNFISTGTVLGAMNELAEARQGFRRCLEVNPDFAPASEKLSLFENHLGGEVR